MEQDPERLAWLEERRKGLGGTDGAAILGVSKFATEFDVWLDKRGEAPARGDTKLTRWGRTLEDVIAQAYTDTYGVPVYNPGRLMRHAAFPFIIGTPDRIAVGNRRGVELKNVSQFAADEWGPAGTDHVPPAYVVQCCHYMLLTDIPEWDVVPLIGGSELRRYTVRRDREFEAAYLERLVWWWDRHIVRGIRPEVTGARSTSDLLARRFALEDEGSVLEADAEDEAALAKLVELRAQRKALEDAEAALENRLKERMGAAAALVGRAGSVTWKGGRPSVKVDWFAVAQDLMARLPEVEVGEVVKQHTNETVGGRRFLVRAPKV